MKAARKRLVALACTAADDDDDAVCARCYLAAALLLPADYEIEVNAHGTLWWVGYLKTMRHLVNGQPSHSGMHPLPSLSLSSQQASCVLLFYGFLRCLLLQGSAAGAPLPQRRPAAAQLGEHCAQRAHPAKRAHR